MKLEVGMYVRNDTFGIFQISKIEMIPVDNQLGDGNRYKLTLFKNDKDGISFYYIKPVDDLSNSLTSSFNLIDLIEENDVITFEYAEQIITANVIEWSENNIGLYFVHNDEANFWNLENLNIKSILTHELYEANCYKVVE